MIANEKQKAIVVFFKDDHKNQFKHYGRFCDIFIACKEIDHVSEFFWLTVNFLVSW